MKQGLCIGGPLNGSKLTSQWEVHEMWMPLPVSAVPRAGEDPTKGTREVFTYVHYTLFSQNRSTGQDTRHEFWIPQGSEHPHLLIFETLMESHHHFSRLRKLIGRAYRVIDWCMSRVDLFHHPDVAEVQKVLQETSQIEYEDRL
jgi:hypothetical protein